MSSNSMQQALGKAALVAAFLIALVPSYSHAALYGGGELCASNPNSYFCVGVNDGNAAGSGGGVGQMRYNASLSGLSGAPISLILKNTVFWLLSILGFIGIIAFVVAGIMYLVAAGDDDLTERAKEALKYSIIGVIVALLGLIIMQAIDAWLSGSVTF